MTDYKSIAQKAIESGVIKFAPPKKDFVTEREGAVHGRDYTYVTLRCRCTLCKKAYLEYGRKYNKTYKRKRKRINPWCYII